MFQAFKQITNNVPIKKCNNTLYTTDRLIDKYHYKPFIDCNKQIEINSTREFVKAIVNSKLVVTERLHPAILACCYGIPFLYIQTTSKSKALKALLKSKCVNHEATFIDMENTTIGIPSSVFLENCWCYLYGAIDKSGALIDVYLSDTRDTFAAKRFFNQCVKQQAVNRTGLKITYTF